jgi:hypothetical protein
MVIDLPPLVDNRNKDLGKSGASQSAATIRTDIAFLSRATKAARHPDASV